tara:strand:+ start:57266 stop:57553 length:288 start_codon:yes stop_codon:yes gene_type:complete
MAVFFVLCEFRIERLFGFALISGHRRIVMWTSADIIPGIFKTVGVFMFTEVTVKTPVAADACALRIIAIKTRSEVGRVCKFVLGTFFACVGGTVI